MFKKKDNIKLNSIAVTKLVAYLVVSNEIFKHNQTLSVSYILREIDVNQGRSIVR